MPLHDWTRVPSGLFHHFHQDWSIEIARCLNKGMLPKGVSALVEQRSGPLEADVLAVERRTKQPPRDAGTFGGTQTLERPAAAIIRRSTNDFYNRRANRIVVRHHLGRIVAVIEIISPSNKDSRGALKDFVDKTVDFIQKGIHVLVVDLFPPTPRDPLGLHKAIWDELEEEDFTFPQGKDRILASYEAGDEYVAYVEPIAVGDKLPDMPLFLARDLHIYLPLESTYRSTWEASPEEMRIAVETGVLPDMEEV